MTDELLFDIGAPVSGSVLTQQADASAVPPAARMPDHVTISLPFTPLTGAALDEKRIFRYALWRRFLEKGPTLMFCMLNPSSADELKNDPTITRCEGFARDLGFARLVVGNLFAFRSTDQRNLKWVEDPVGPDNDAWLIKLRKMSQMCICAWGVNGGLLGQDHHVMVMLRELGPLHCLKKTKAGKPGHPLYLRADLKPVEYR